MIFPRGHTDGHPYADILAQIAYGVEMHGGIKISFLSRNLNMVADWLADAALRFDFGVHVITSPFGDCHRLLR